VVAAIVVAALVIEPDERVGEQVADGAGTPASETAGEPAYSEAG
jgi:hypothetical protein